MSRYEYTLKEPKNGITCIAYGWDHATGYFFQAFDATDDDPKIDLDSMFHNLSGPKLAQQLDEFDVPIPAMHRASMLLDLSF